MNPNLKCINEELFRLYCSFIDKIKNKNLKNTYLKNKYSINKIYNLKND